MCKKQARGAGVLPIARSESWKIGKLFLASVNMHASELGAAMQGRNRLAGIEQAVLVERALDAVEGFEFRRLELDAHLVDLFHAHAVLAGDGAADLQAQLEYFGAESFRARELAGLVGVVEDERVQVAVAGVEYVGAAQAMLLFHLGDRAQHRAELLARDGAVHA